MFQGWLSILAIGLAGALLALLILRLALKRLAARMLYAPLLSDEDDCRHTASEMKQARLRISARDTVRHSRARLLFPQRSFPSTPSDCGLEQP